MSHSEMRTASKHPGCTINRIELHQTHAELEHAHITYTCTHQSTVAEKPGFSSSPYLIRHHIPVSERLLVSDSPPSSSSSGSSVPSHYHNNCTYSIFTLLCCFHNNNGREHYPEWFSQWRWLLFGWLYYWGQWSWQPLCACFGFMHAFMHSQLHTLMHSYVCLSEGQSLHDSVCDCDIHLFLIKENVANWSTMFRVDIYPQFVMQI